MEPFFYFRLTKAFAKHHHLVSFYRLIRFYIHNLEFLNADTAYNSVFLTDISCAYKFDKNPFDSALANDIIYKATVTTSNTNTIKHYIGMVATAMNLNYSINDTELRSIFEN
jgi:hypothetical protein